MAVILLEMDEDFHVAMARSLVEAPQSALVAMADPESSAGSLVLADTYAEAEAYAQEWVAKGWHAVIWEVPNRRPGR